MVAAKNLTDAEVAAPFIKATLVVLSTMSGIEASVGKPYVKKENIAEGDVSAIVGVTGDRNGSIAVSFSRSCATALVRGMLGDDIEDPLQDTHDAVGEVTNMISGQARSGLTESGLTLQGTTPTVIIGNNHIVTHSSSAKVIAIPFQSPDGNFTVEFCFE